MADQTTRRRRRPSSDDPVRPDDAAYADLSRAARAAVRSEPDPRLDAFAAHLGLGADDDPAAPPRRRDERADAGEIETLRSTVGALGARLDRAEQRVALVTWILGAVAVAMAIVVIATLARGAG